VTRPVDVRFREALAVGVDVGLGARSVDLDLSAYAGVSRGEPIMGGPRIGVGVGVVLNLPAPVGMVASEIQRQGPLDGRVAEECGLTEGAGVTDGEIPGRWGVGRVPVVSLRLVVAADVDDAADGFVDGGERGGERGTGCRGDARRCGRRDARIDRHRQPDGPAELGGEEIHDRLPHPLLEDFLGEVVGSDEKRGAVEKTYRPGQPHEGALLGCDP
jgi:hypothetical protein